MVYLAPYRIDRKSCSLTRVSTHGMTAQKAVFATDRFEQLYTPDEMAHFSRSKAIAKYIERKKTASVGSGTAYSTHLRAFAQYIYRKQKKALSYHSCQIGKARF